LSGAGQTASPLFGLLSSGKSLWNRRKLNILAKVMGMKLKGFAVLAILFGLYYFWPHSESVEEYQEKLIASVNQELAQSDNPIRKKIEAAHVTVTAKSARVTHSYVETVDGSSNAGRNGRNVSDINIVITVMWDGLIQKDGYTEFEIVYDSQNKVVKEAKYLRSNALVNIDNIDWFGIGVQIGAYIAEMSM
jgi:hypothetical protein